jgi:hypothetical protein
MSTPGLKRHRRPARPLSVSSLGLDTPEHPRHPTRSRRSRPPLPSSPSPGEGAGRGGRGGQGVRVAPRRAALLFVAWGFEPQAAPRPKRSLPAPARRARATR